MYIDGKFVESKTNDWINVHNPATNEVILNLINIFEYFHFITSNQFS